MRRLYVAQPAGTVALDEAQRRYLRGVLRLADGDALEVFDGRGGRFAARLDGELLRLTPLPPAPARALRVTLAQGIGKGEKMDLVVQKATELGVARIVPLQAERAVVRLDDERAAARVARWRKVAQEAARQCGRADVPQIDAPAGWDAVFALAQSQVGVVLAPGAELRLSQAARGAGEVLLAVGPEGGFSPDELLAAQQAALLLVGLGPLVLRTETAALAALAVLQHTAGELG